MSPSDGNGSVPSNSTDQSELIDIQATMERTIPNREDRLKALSLMAYAIENVDAERSNAWALIPNSSGLILKAGFFVICRMRRGRVSLSVKGPINEELLGQLGAEISEDSGWKLIPDGLTLRFSANKADVALESLKEATDRFVDDVMAKVRRFNSREVHSVAAVEYVSRETGRELPQPNFAMPNDDDADETNDDAQDSKEPLVRGRAPIFEHGQRSIASLVSDVEQKAIALPDLQRPFVWEDTKVRDLLDSLFVGYPVGTLVLWHTSDGRDAQALGRAPEALKANALIIDGQQRLTSLYAVMRGAEVIDQDGKPRRIRIAFRPRDGRLDVADAATVKDPEYLSDVADLWNGVRTKTQIRREILANLRSKGREIDEAYENAVDQNLDRLQAISDYRFPVVDIRRTAVSEEVSEEDVADIFVRINNQGKKLGQADFVLTLLSVFHGPLRDRIETRAAEMAAESVVGITTHQLLRASCAVGFSRARMSAVYKYLRGVDPVTGDTSTTARQARLEALDQAAAQCIDATRWRDFLLSVTRAGFASQGLIASSNAIVNSYAFYIIGTQAGLPKTQLEGLISRWLFGTLLTARYSTSSETVFEQDLERARGSGGDAKGLIGALDAALREELTGDYWSTKLVASLETQRARAPAALAFRAAQIILDARALFSDHRLREVLAPPGKGNRAAAEMHHLFPSDWLTSRGISDKKRINQVANLADVGWHENAVIGAKGPATYVPRLRETLKLDDERWGRMCAEHALPLEWEKMDYGAFLAARRERMATIIRAAYGKLGGESESIPGPPPWFLPGAEEVWGRIAETERALRALVRDVYVAKFGDKASRQIEEALPEVDRAVLARAMRNRPAGSDPLSVVDYLYLAQLPILLFHGAVWVDARQRFSDPNSAKQKINDAIGQVVPVRNEIAHVREVSRDRLQAAYVACGSLMAMAKR